ncbi:MAG: hypothetical protein K0S63_1384, partial [Gammaproteobacteria bacterium]|nr:hypothetical protein [Gammaproteobacteria bacterium]
MGIVDASAALLNEGVSTCSATAGFLLTAFGIVGTGGALVPLLALSSILLIPMKIFHIKRLESRSTRLQNTTTKKMYTALRNKEAGTALALGVTTLGAGVLSIHSAASAAITMGVLHPALSLMALGFAINALVEFYDNVCQWREVVNTRYYTE